MSEFSVPESEIMTNTSFNVSEAEEGAPRVEDLTKEQALQDAGENVARILELRQMIGREKGGSGGTLQKFEDSVISGWQTEIYGLQADTQDLIKVHNLTEDQILTKAAEIDSDFSAFKENYGSDLRKILDIQFGPVKAQG